jgi:hypothetical protein
MVPASISTCARSRGAAEWGAEDILDSAVRIGLIRNNAAAARTAMLSDAVVHIDRTTAVEPIAR